MKIKPAVTPENKKQERLALMHVSVTEFAKKKNVSRAVIYTHIKDKKIIPDLVGLNEMPMIDWAVYAQYEFAPPKWNAESFRNKINSEPKPEPADENS